jgi:hypothetical protein
MRRIVLGLLTLGLLVPGLGCMAVSSHVRGACHRSVIVYRDELYVVDVAKCVAHKVTMTECPDQAESSEVVVVETEN